MDYSEIFSKPITEMTDEEIIARAAELREMNKLVKVAPATKATKSKAPKLSATAQKQEDLFAGFIAKATAAKKS